MCDPGIPLPLRYRENENIQPHKNFYTNVQSIIHGSQRWELPSADKGMNKT